MKPLPLATVADPAQVERVRDLIDGRPCVVVGSAPLATKCADISDTDVAIAVNGGISSVARAVDLWVVASRTQDRPGNPRIKPLHRVMLNQAKGRTVGHVLLLRGPKEPSERDTLAALDELRVILHTWSVLDKPTKWWLEHTLCGRKTDKDPCSSGILATAIALWCGASSVRLVGFSWTPGYHYIRKERAASWWRNHVKADQQALKLLKARYGSALCGEILSQVAA